MIYTFCNNGNYYNFKPHESVTPFSQKHQISNLAYYKYLVSQANSPAIYILDETGGIVGSVPGTSESYQTYAKRFKKLKKSK